MTDLEQRIRDYYDGAGPPLDVRAIVAGRAQSAPGRQRRRVIGAMVAAAAAVVLMLVAYILVVPESASPPVIDQPPAIDPAPTRTTGTTATDAVSDADATEVTDDIIPFPSASTRPGATQAPTPDQSGRDGAPATPTGRIIYATGDTIRALDLDSGTGHEVAIGSQPRWSPDARYVSYREPGTGNLWTIGADGTDPTRVSEADVSYDGAPFSPHGSRLVYTAGPWDCGPDADPLPPFGCAPSDDAGVWTIGVDGSNPRRVATGAAANPAWSPDGARVAYARDGAIWSASANGGEERLLHRPAVGESAHRPRFSPDGTHVAFYVEDASASNDACGPPMELWTVNADASQPQRMGGGPYWPGSAGSAYVRAPQWSPDGTGITFADEINVWVVDRATGTSRPVLATQGRGCGKSDAAADPAWSPDGQFIVAFSMVPDGASVGLIAVRPMAREFHLLVPGINHAPSWRS